MLKKQSPSIPIVNPVQFDEYLFANWKAPVFDFYEQFHIERIENYKNHLVLPTPPHRRSVNFFIFLTKGTVIRSKGLSNYTLEKDNFFFLPADQITSVEYVSDDAEGFYCHFITEIFQIQQLKIDFERDFSFFQLTSNPSIDVKNGDKMITLFEILYKEYQYNEKERFGLIPLYLTVLLTEVMYSVSTSSEKSPVNAASHLAQRYKNLLSKYIYDKKSVKDFAALLGITPNHLHKSIKAATGKTAHDLLEDMRILEAKVLLRQSDLSISEIAYKLGEFDSSDFTRFFKSKTQQTPKQYRQNM